MVRNLNDSSRGDIVPLPDGTAAIGVSKKWAPIDHVHPTIIAGGSASTLTLTKDNNGVERSFFKDDFSNNTIANYTLSGASPSIAAGIMSVPATGQAYKTIIAGTTGRWEGVVEFTAAGAGTAKLLLGDAGTSYVIVTRIVTTRRIWLELFIGGVSKIANTDTTVTLADSAFARVSATYDGTSWQMSWAGVAVGANTAAITVTTPIIGVAAGTIASAWDELTFIPSTAFQDLMGADTETRYMQLASTDITQPASTGTWAASASGDVVIGSGYMTVASDNDEAEAVVLRSYNFASGEIEFSLDVNNADVNQIEHTGLLFGYQDILNHYKLVIIDDQAGTETLQFYKVVAGVATALGSAGAIAAYTRGNKTWIKVHYSRETGQMWAYLRDDAGVYPTTPDIADAFSSQFSYGKVGFWSSVAAVGAGNINVRFDDLTVRANLLIGETNIPATESSFYFRDEFTVDSTGRYNTYTNGAGIAVTVTGGSLSVADTGAGDRGTAVLSSVKLSDVTAECDFTLNTNGQYAQFMVGSDGTMQSGSTPKNGYFIYAVQGTSSNFEIRRLDSGNSTLISSSVSKTINTGVKYHLKFTYNSATGVLNGCFDNEASPSITATSTVYPNGHVLLSGDALGGGTILYDNLTISGTRYYMKPMLLGAQIGEYYNVAATVQSSRFTSDGDWNQITEFTTGGSASAYDTTNGWLTLADATAIYPTGISLGWGHYAFLLKRSTGATDVFNCNIAGNAITTTGAGVTTIGGTAYTGTALTSPALVEFVVTGTQIAVYSNGVLIGTKTGLTLTPGTIQLSRTTANIYVYAMNFNALDSTSTNGISATLGGVPHGARYDYQEEAYSTFTNPCTNGEFFYQSRAKSTYPTTADFEYYFINSTDSTAINWDGQTTATLTPGTTFVDGIARSLLRYQDVADTIKLSVRRKNYSGVTYDNQPAVFVDHLAYVPVWMV